MPDSDWTLVGDIDIRRCLSVSDTSYFYDEPIMLPMAAGTYTICVHNADVEGNRHVMAIKVTCSSEGSNRGRRLGEVIVDFGQLGICDRDAVEKAFEVLGDLGMSTYFDQLQTATGLTGWIVLPGAVRMAMIRPGFGDGRYPVFELLDGTGNAVGVEIECSISKSDHETR
ncbi:MAG TPA: hypothetical protein VHO06_14365 [Polyangia bacterium]|nr:hypothetical protein [Polyangia bacterium]